MGKLVSFVSVLCPKFWPARFMDLSGRDSLRRLASGAHLVSCAEPFRRLVAKLRFVPVSETTIEARHQKATVSRKKATNAGAVEMSLANRKELLAVHLQTKEGLQALTVAFAKARKLRKVPAIFGVADHPLIAQEVEKCRRGGGHVTPSKLVKPLTAILYNTDIESQYADTSGLKSQHRHATARNAKAAAEAAHLHPPKRMSWESGLFWEHVQAQARRGAIISLPKTTANVSVEAVHAAFAPRHASANAALSGSGGLTDTMCLDDSGEVGAEESLQATQGIGLMLVQQDLIDCHSLIFMSMCKSNPAQSHYVPSYSGSCLSRATARCPGLALSLLTVMLPCRLLDVSCMCRTTVSKIGSSLQQTVCVRM